MRFYLCNIFFYNFIFYNMMTSLQSKKSQNVLLSDSLFGKDMMMTPFGWHFLVVGVFYILHFGRMCWIWVGANFSVLSTCTPQILNELSTPVHRAAQHIRAMKFLYHIAPEVHLYHMLSIVCFHLYSWPLDNEDVPISLNIDSTRGPEISFINFNKN